MVVAGGGGANDVQAPEGLFVFVCVKKFNQDYCFGVFNPSLPLRAPRARSANAVKLSINKLYPNTHTHTHT